MNLTFAIKEKDIANLLVGAFEGGSNYWITKLGEPKIGRETEKLDGDYPSYVVAPISGGFVTVYDEDHDRGISLNKAALHDGLAVMAEKYPKHFGDFISENDDATTADVFLQCALFGEIVYG